ncbi:MAG TPA: hypothetical protein PK890_02190, partial [Terrimesophilobacter sp.]|nr:hypothetical protein [Terrimesophilobacter sp.]
MAAELASALVTTIVTVAVIAVAALVVGFWWLSRKRLRFGPASKIDARQQEANILLVRADDAVTAAGDEVGFAIAQFGAKKAAPFVTALDEARTQLREAFELQQRLDDAYPDTLTQRRDWSDRIAMLCRSIQSSLDTHSAEFRGLRQRESDAPRTRDALVARLETLETARDAASGALGRLTEHYAPRAISSVADNVRRADTALTLARELLAETKDTIAAGNAVGETLLRIAEHLSRAEQFFDAIDALETELAKASSAASDLRAATEQNLTEARQLRESSPDAASSNTISTAMSTVSEALAQNASLPDPLVELERLRQANAALDQSMANARNQQRRLDGARTAL